MDLSRYAELFLTESREHLSAMNQSLLELERAPGAREPILTIFRAVHTIKGMSASMGYAPVAELTHELETLLDQVRSGARALTPPLMTALFRSADALDQAIEASTRGGTPPALNALLVELRAVQQLPAAGAAAAPAMASQVIHVRLLPGTAMRGARAMLIVRHAQTLGTVFSLNPTIEELAAESFERDFVICLDTTLDPAQLEQEVRRQGDVEHVRIHADRRSEERQADAEAAAAGADGPQRVRRHLRIDSRRLDGMMNLVGELVIARDRLLELGHEIASAPLDDALDQASRLISDLQGEVLRARMVPASHVFDRFPRLVRDAAHSAGKEVELVVEGGEIELDRALLDEIGDPVLHLLRNAVDHGIELPEARVAAGKPRSGRLTLTAARERSVVSVRVSDDGRGVDRPRVLERARALGLVDPAKQEVTNAELLQLMAHPGLTTAPVVTELSGRGVGVDVVHSRVRTMGGVIELESEPGVGTTMTLRLPATLAIVRALLARVDDETYAIPMAHVNETVELAPATLRRLTGRDVIVLRDDVLPLLRFRDMVKLAARTGPGGTVVVIGHGERRAGLAVDSVVGQQDIVVKQYDAVRGAVPFFSGATILGDGAPALIVDVGTLLTRSLDA